MEPNGKTEDYLPRFRRSLQRLIIETANARKVAACWRAMENESSSNWFLHEAPNAFQSDLQIRLIRILENSPDTSSFWYLYRCEPDKVSFDVDVAKLRGFSERLKKVRDKVFVHIDKTAVFDPEAIYKEVNIRGYEIVDALETVWRVLNRLYEDYEGKKFPGIQVPFDRLCLDFKREFSKLLKGTQS